MAIYGKVLLHIIVVFFFGEYRKTFCFDQNGFKRDSERNWN